MKKGFFGIRSRKSGGKMPGTPLNISVFVFITLVFISLLLLMFSSSNFILNVKNTGMSVFSGARGGIYELTSFVSRTILSISELADLRREHAELLKQLERFQELERSNAEIYQENIRTSE